MTTHRFRALRERLALVLLLSAACAATAPILVAQPPARGGGPGYFGTSPSPHGKAVLRALFKTRQIDKTARLGGGSWRITNGGVVPHPLGPGRADVHELRNAQTKGPHVLLVQGKCAFFLPTRNDGDVAALLRLLGRPANEDLEATAVSPQWREAERRVAGLGAARRGVRIGLVPQKSGRAVSVILWNVSDKPIDLRGRAKLKVDDAMRDVVLLWPPKPVGVPGISRVRLQAGSTYEQSFALRARDGAARDGKTRERRALFLFRVEGPADTKAHKKADKKADKDAARRQVRSRTIRWTPTKQKAKAPATEKQANPKKRFPREKHPTPKEET